MSPEALNLIESMKIRLRYCNERVAIKTLSLAERCGVPSEVITNVCSPGGPNEWNRWKKAMRQVIKIAEAGLFNPKPGECSNHRPTRSDRASKKPAQKRSVLKPTT